MTETKRYTALLRRTENKFLTLSITHPRSGSSPPMFSESNIGQSDRGLGRKDPLNYFWVLCSITCIALRPY